MSLDSFNFEHLLSLLHSIPILGGLIADNPVHLTIEVGLLIFTIYLLLQKSYKPEPEKLTRREEDELIDEWNPDPIVKPLTPLETFELANVPLVTSTADRTIVVNGKECLNMATFNFIGIAAHPQVIEAANKAVEKYGCGSCGPRGFYGTLDIHLELESRLCEFMKAEGACVYSSAYATATSVVPAFSQLQDIIVADAGVNHALRGGIFLSKSTAHWFQHQDLADLERVLQSIVAEDKVKKRKLTRRWIVIEGVSSDSGRIVDLPGVLALARRYCFRVMLDESNAIGVLGATGRGTCEHYGMATLDIDIIFADLSRAIASTSGFCCGKREIADHQRLNGSGYCFSASLPPYLCASALVSLRLIDEEPDRLKRLHDNSTFAHELLMTKLSRYFDVPSTPGSPLLHLRLKRSFGSRLEDEQVLQRIVDNCFDQAIALTRSKNSRKLWSSSHVLPPPSIRLSLMSEHSKDDISRVINAIDLASAKVFQ